MLFIGFLGFPINKILYLLFLVQNITLEKHFKKKRVSTQRHNNLTLLKGSKRFLTRSSCGLPLEAKHLDYLWFAQSSLEEII